MRTISILLFAFSMATGLFVGILNPQLFENVYGITDGDLGIVWLKNAKAPNSRSLTYQEALDYVNELNDSNYLGYSDWRLPGGTNPSSNTCTTNDGVYYYNCTDTEFGHLFYDELGGCAGWPIQTKCIDQYPFTVENDDPDLGLFDDLPSLDNTLPGVGFQYWTSMQDGASSTWAFSFQSGSYAAVSSGPSSTYRLNAWVVRDCFMVLLNRYCISLRLVRVLVFLVAPVVILPIAYYAYRRSRR